MEKVEPYKPVNKVRIVTAASLFDGHDAAINIMRRIIQSTGCEVIHLGHDRSVEEVVELRYRCNNKLKDENGEEKSCGGAVEFDLNLLEITPTKNPEHTNKIQLTDNLGVCLKYPTFEMIQKYETMDENDVMMNVLVDCIDFIYDKDSVYYAKDSTKEELIDFVDNLQQVHLEKIKKFFDTLPEIKKDVHFKCPKCGYEEDIEIKGMQNFFV